jgi:CheY-like chemotaxis protein/two-component sensor histidine kinase
MDVALQALASQFDALLDISRLDAGVVKVNTNNFRLNGLIERANNEFKPIAEGKGLTLNIDCPDDVTVCTDEALLERIVVNLLSNAVKYTESGNVSATVRVADGHCTIDIVDTGKGIPEEEQSHVFDEFYQVGNPQRDRREGFGLGLSIVQRLVELLDLDLNMTSDVGVGTRFLLTLPAIDEVEKRAQALPEDISLAGLSVLAIDDEIDVALGTQTLLEELGCSVRIAEGTSGAVEIVRNWKPDIMLVDFRLRDDDDGLICVEAVRKIHDAMPAIIVSGDTAPDRIREANEAGLQLLHKPVIIDELKHAMADALEKKPS